MWGNFGQKVQNCPKLPHNVMKMRKGNREKSYGTTMRLISSIFVPVMCYVIWQDKICQSTCPKIIPFSRANITIFISDQWHFAAHVNLSTLNLPLFISVFH